MKNHVHAIEMYLEVNGRVNLGADTLCRFATWDFGFPGLFQQGPLNLRSSLSSQMMPQHGPVSHISVHLSLIWIGGDESCSFPFTLYKNGCQIQIQSNSYRELRDKARPNEISDQFLISLLRESNRHFSKGPLKLVHAPQEVDHPCSAISFQIFSHKCSG